MTGCKKQVGLKSQSEADYEQALWLLRHWCNQAKKYTRQRSHVSFNPSLAALPTHEDISRQQITEPPPDVLQADDVLDGDLPAAAAASETESGCDDSARNSSGSSESENSSSSSSASPSSSSE